MIRTKVNFGIWVLVTMLVVGLVLSGCTVTGPEDTKEEDKTPEAVTWQKMFGGSGEDVALSIQQTSDGGYIVAGYSPSTDITGVTNNGDRDVYIVKLDSTGAVSWQKMDGGSGNDVGFSIQQTSDGGYITAGWSKSTDISGVTNNGEFDFYILKLDSAGALSWQKMYGGSFGDFAISIQQTSDGGYIVAGSSNSTDITGVTNNGDSDAYIVKLDSTGALSWQKMFGGSGSDSAISIQQTNDGGYIVAGSSNSTDISGVTNNGFNDFYLVKLDSTGALSWQKMYGGSGNDVGFSIQQTSDGGYIVAGSSNSTDITGVTNNGDRDVYIVKLDSAGVLSWQKMFGGSFGDFAISIQQTSDGGYIVGGYSKSTDISGVTNNGEFDFYILKLDSAGALSWQKMYGGSGDDLARSIQQTSDGGYIVGGYSKSTDIFGVTNKGDRDVYIVKLDTSGTGPTLSTPTPTPTLTPTPSGDITWAIKSPMPTARCCLAVGVINNKIYAIGGGIFPATVEEYDPATDQWTTKAPMPTNRAYLAAGVVNNKIYAIGANNKNTSTTVEEYDTALDQWTMKAPMPTGRWLLAIGVVKDKIYAIGGRVLEIGVSEDALATVEEYDPTTDKWTTRSPMSTARGSLAVGVVNNKIYAIGGASSKFTALATVEEYDPATNIWTNCGTPAPGNACTPMPTRRASLAIGVMNNKIYAIGGDPGSVATVEEYDPATNIWRAMTSMPTGRWELAVGVVNDKIYAIGGEDSNFTAFATVEEGTIQ